MVKREKDKIVCLSVQPPVVDAFIVELKVIA